VEEEIAPKFNAEAHGVEKTSYFFFQSVMGLLAKSIFTRGCQLVCPTVVIMIFHWKNSNIPPLKDVYIEGANRSTYSLDDCRTVSTHLLFTFKYYLYLIHGCVKHKNLKDAGLAILNSTAIHSAKLDSTALV
jgi:hypothetical protein